MSKPQDPAVTALERGMDYAALIDREGREHLITRDMVDSMIDGLVAGSDYSLQGKGRFACGANSFKYSQTRPHWGE